jgi:hypothetical protein
MQEKYAVVSTQGDHLAWTPLFLSHILCYFVQLICFDERKCWVRSREREMSRDRDLAHFVLKERELQ